MKKVVKFEYLYLLKFHAIIDDNSCLQCKKKILNPYCELRYLTIDIKINKKNYKIV